ncbi:hypothetical protein AAFF_G00370090 [Aldrovandia affinis]|uniref:Uncharacterized protein n=1 Tax=Aldrovandia affinis TaxID=143900 RepID=A0AAD7SGI2_9TELE|nr:hypothetical protein AAFF_G00370090 [Aldrovandia affinis]
MLARTILIAKRGGNATAASPRGGRAPLSFMVGLTCQRAAAEVLDELTRTTLPFVQRLSGGGARREWEEGGELEWSSIHGLNGNQTEHLTTPSSRPRNHNMALSDVEEHK